MDIRLLVLYATEMEKTANPPPYTEMTPTAAPPQPQAPGPITHDCYWRDYSFRTIPCDAIEINGDGKYVGQVYIKGGLIPATIYPYLDYAITDLYGKKVVRKHVKILCCPDSNKLSWDYVDFNRPPADGQMKNAILGGFYEDGSDEYNYFIGKAVHEGEWKVGRVISVEHFHKGLFLWNNTGGERDKLQQFYMLKYNI